MQHTGIHPAEFFAATELHKIELEMPDDTWSYLRDNAVELDDTTTFTPISVSIDGAFLGEVGIRPKGGRGTLRSCAGVGAASGSKACPKLSYKLKFSEVDDDKRFVGLKRLNLQSAVADESLLDEYFAYELFRRMGLPTPRVTFSEVFLNGELLVTYPLVEEVDTQFLKSRFRDSSGNLYKNLWPVGVAEGRWTGMLQTNEEAPDHAPLKALRDDFAVAEEDRLAATLERHVQTDLFAAFVEVDRAIESWDGPLRFRYFPNGVEYRGNNFFLYHDPQSQRFVVIPWDLDHSMSRVNPLPKFGRWNDATIDCASEGLVEDTRNTPTVAYLEPACDPMVKALAQRGAEAEHSRLFGDVFRVAEMRTELSEKVALLLNAVVRDPDRDVQLWQKAVTRLADDFSYLVAAATGVQDEL
jgi:spore coat protein CotH